MDIDDCSFTLLPRWRSLLKINIHFQDGLVRVLLDGGPYRIFFPSDAKILEDDLEALKVCGYKFSLKCHCAHRRSPENFHWVYSLFWDY